jgi:hypothetical protein
MDKPTDRTISPFLLRSQPLLIEAAWISFRFWLEQ